MLERTKELAELSGMLLTDGGVTCVSGKWRVHFTTTSDILEGRFKELVIKVLNRHPSKASTHSGTQQNASINKIINELHELSPTFRTKPCNHFPICPKLRGKHFQPCSICNPIKINNEMFPPAKIPEFIFNDKHGAIDFLRAAFTCDGSIILSVAKSKNGFRLDRKVVLSCEHPQLKEQHAQFLVQLGFKPKIRKDCIVLGGKENIVKFQKEIGFIDGVRIIRNGRWGGMEKSKLLKLCVKSFDMPEIFELKSVEEIFSFLKNLLLGQEACRSNPEQDEVLRKRDGGPIPIVRPNPSGDSGLGVKSQSR